MLIKQILGVDWVACHVDFVVGEGFVEDDDLPTLEVHINDRPTALRFGQRTQFIDFYHFVFFKFMQHGTVLNFHQVEVQKLGINTQVKAIEQDIFLELYVSHRGVCDIGSKLGLRSDHIVS